jgi:hypothetical protein
LLCPIYTVCVTVSFKRASGWFAAGHEVESGLRLLSDAAFKLYVWLCLHADRSLGSIIVTPAALARVLQKTEGEVTANLQELSRNGVCVRRQDTMIEITDRFWPYQRVADPGASDDRADYIGQVKRCFLERSCVRSVFTAADEKLAARLCRDRVPLTPQCKIVYDKFHILQHANDAIDEVRRAEFFRHGKEKRS